MPSTDTQLTATNDERVLWHGSPSQWINFKYFFPSWLLMAGAAVAAHQLAQPLIYAVAGLVALFPLWKWLVVRTTQLTLTNERLKIRTGVFSRRTHELELYRVKDTALDEPFILRLVSLGNVEIVSSDRTHPKFLIPAVRQAAPLREKIRECVERLRASKGVRELDTE